ncbi:response regulator transcription factor [bacterium AH-315-J19]|nr:response regulator transcription factor [Robiginitomaculum sp.]MBN4058505.1 response regulator transcription factor [bacterium AH-315-J19]
MIRIIIAEDQSMLRGALASLLSLEDDIEVMGEAKDGREALDLVKRLKPDVLVTDIEMPEYTGIEVAQKLKRDGSKTRVLIVTTFARSGYLQRARDAGVTGYILKDTSSDELSGAVRTVAKGGTVITPELLQAAWTTPDPLTDTERRILRLVEAGKTNKQISAELNLTPGTVRNYLAGAAHKLGASNRIEAFRTARENGWL